MTRITVSVLVSVSVLMSVSISAISVSAVIASGPISIAKWNERHGEERWCREEEKKKMGLRRKLTKSLPSSRGFTQPPQPSSPPGPSLTSRQKKREYGELGRRLPSAQETPPKTQNPKGQKSKPNKKKTLHGLISLRIDVTGGELTRGELTGGELIVTPNSSLCNIDIPPQRATLKIRSIDHSTPSSPLHPSSH